jgi:hypothetical protein
LLNAQVICDCNKYITDFITGWPGSCADSFVFKKMKLHIQPAGFFDQGRSSGFDAFMGLTDFFECFCLDQYLLANSAYKLTQTVVPAYKAPAAYQQANAEFNFHLAKSRVWNEHCIGILKNQFASLKEMRLHLHSNHHMDGYINWIYACMIFHYMLAKLSDSWEDCVNDGDITCDNIEPQGRVAALENMQTQVKLRCLQHFQNQAGTA